MARWPRAPWRKGASLLGGVLLVAALGGVVRPRQGDLAHTIGVLTARRGTVVHSAHFAAGADVLGRYTVFVTAAAAPPVAGDIRVELRGPAPVAYTVASRYPPQVALANGLRPWYRFEGSTLKGVSPGDDVIVVVRIDAPVAAGEYELDFSDARSGRTYLAMPVTFAAPACLPPENAAAPCCE